ncbi:SMI1/KNR4 family protein [Catenovulum sp. SM1970]|uniref:SMI1/KNR4 family protein n=1 Tax=Marinifaba aquimaris TaxID=2741323 RepID=UPI001574DAD7|nr:SMI1/KNR4 family protein [Marinifaba aquimaris]NTS77882.1 SMI1/KNR4 family protein [Marinifaba aquimaris]
MMLTITQSKRMLCEKDISDAQNELNLIFPEQYTRFLLVSNGGVPKQCAIDFNGVDIKVNGDDVKLLFSIQGKKSRDLVLRYLNKDIHIPTGLIVIAQSELGNYFLLSARQDCYGVIFYKDHEIEDTLAFEPEQNLYPESIVKISDDFEEFLQSLYQPDE